MPIINPEEDILKQYLLGKYQEDPMAIDRARERSERKELMGGLGTALNTISRSVGANVSDEPYKQMTEGGQKVVGEEMARQKMLRDYLKDKAEMAIKGKSLDVQTKTLDADLADKRYRRDLEEKKAGADAKKLGMQTEEGLRKEYNSQEIVKQTPLINKYVDTIKSAATKDNAAADISLVYAFMKLNDPTSSVREGEYATAQNSAGVSEQIRNLYNQAIKGSKLSARQRAQFAGQAMDIQKTHNIQLDDINQRYSGLSNRYGVQSGNVVPQAQKPVQAPTSVRAIRKSDGKSVTIAGTQSEVDAELSKGLYEVSK